MGQMGPRAICILSATGAVSSAVIRTSGDLGYIRYEACFSNSFSFNLSTYNHGILVARFVFFLGGVVEVEFSTLSRTEHEASGLGFFMILT